MTRRIFTGIAGLMFCVAALAAGTSIWNATARGTVAGTDRLPVATSSSSGPLYVTPATIKAFTFTPPISALVPDDSPTGGNARGDNAVDWQTLLDPESGASMVASGFASVLSGGQYNTSSGIASTVSGGYYGTASGDNSTVAGGSSNSASAASATVSGGTTNSASGDYSSVSGGSGNTAAGVNSHVAGGDSNTAESSSANVAGGAFNVAAGSGAWIPGGYYARTRGLRGAGAYAAGVRYDGGDSQVIMQPVRATTADATPTPLSATGDAPDSTTVMVLPAESTSTCTAIVTANNSASGTISMAGFTVNAIAKNDSSTISVSGGTCVAVGTPDAALATASCALVGNGSRDSVELQATGVVATDVYWVADIKCVQAM